MIDHVLTEPFIPIAQSKKIFIQYILACLLAGLNSNISYSHAEV